MSLFVTLSRINYSTNHREMFTTDFHHGEAVGKAADRARLVVHGVAFQDKHTLAYANTYSHAAAGR